MTKLRPDTNPYAAQAARAATREALLADLRNHKSAAASVRQDDGSLKSAALVAREAEQAERAEEYAEARERIEAAKAAKDAARAKSDGRHTHVPPGVSSVEHASALLDRARQNPGDRDLAARAIEAAASAGLPDYKRGSCFGCGRTDAYPLVVPNAGIAGFGWACDLCARGRGRARF